LNVVQEVIEDIGAIEGIKVPKAIEGIEGIKAPRGRAVLEDIEGMMDQGAFQAQ